MVYCGKSDKGLGFVVSQVIAPMAAMPPRKPAAGVSAALGGAGLWSQEVRPGRLVSVRLRAAGIRSSSTLIPLTLTTMLAASAPVAAR